MTFRDADLAQSVDEDFINDSATFILNALSSYPEDALISTMTLPEFILHLNNLQKWLDENKDISSYYHDLFEKIQFLLLISTGNSIIENIFNSIKKNECTPENFVTVLITKTLNANENNPYVLTQIQSIDDLLFLRQDLGIKTFSPDYIEAHADTILKQLTERLTTLDLSASDPSCCIFSHHKTIDIPLMSKPNEKIRFRVSYEPDQVRLEFNSEKSFTQFQLQPDHPVSSFSKKGGFPDEYKIDMSEIDWDLYFKNTIQPRCNDLDARSFSLESLKREAAEVNKLKARYTEACRLITRNHPLTNKEKIRQVNALTLKFKQALAHFRYEQTSFFDVLIKVNDAGKSSSSASSSTNQVSFQVNIRFFVQEKELALRSINPVKA